MLLTGEVLSKAHLSHESYAPDGFGIASPNKPNHRSPSKKHDNLEYEACPLYNSAPLYCLFLDMSSRFMSPAVKHKTKELYGFDKARK